MPDNSEIKVYDNGFNLESYLSDGVEDIIKQLLLVTAFNPKESIFMAKYARAGKKAAELRKAAERRGEHIPPFLIASITSKCNLHCTGCYARALHTCADDEPMEQMSADEWERVFNEAGDMGIGFILLAGGEPMVRKDVILKAAAFPQILFLIFTNGTMITDEYIDIFDRYRNLIPIFSIEGGEASTDIRRGEGIYRRVHLAMERLRKQKIIFGASVTVTSENMLEVVSGKFTDKLKDYGCKAVIYVEFVPTEDGIQDLALSEENRAVFEEKIAFLRNNKDSLLLISFPGDEKSSGGCLAAGRGFFHINSHGGAEPCPFSPYSDINVREHTLKEVMNSELFKNLRNSGLLLEEHEGGCVLFNKRKQVKEIELSLHNKS